MATHGRSGIQRWLDFSERQWRRQSAAWIDEPPISSFMAEKAEAKDYLAEKIKKVHRGLKNVSSVVNLGYGAEEITMLTGKNA